MTRIALYREWRPRTFDQVVDQRHTVAALRQSVVSGNISHAYLFAGTRGTGKTTLAQIFSRAINCLAPDHGNPCNTCEVCQGILSGALLDVVEVDAASHNSVDNIRRICDEVQFLPTRAKYKVYIIDEVHMLSAGAFNALLKTLEEPPAHAVFILATTDPHRIPPTIISRCQRYDFHRIPVAGIVARLRAIADTKEIQATDEALTTIASLADGALRDAISLLDQSRATFPTGFARDDVLSLTGVVDDAFMYAMAGALADQDAARAMELTDAMILDGRDVVRFTSDLAAYYRDVMMSLISSQPETLVRASADSIQQMQTLATRYDLDTLLAMVRDLAELLTHLRWAPDPRTLFEITLIRIMQTAPATQNSAPEAPHSDAPAPAVQPPAAAPVVLDAPVAKPDAAHTSHVAADRVDIPHSEPEPAAPAAATEPAAPAVQLPAAAPVVLDAPVAKPDAAHTSHVAADSVDIPHPEPVADDGAVETIAPTDAPSATVLQRAWEEMLTALCQDGQMVLYLYLRPARATFTQGRITVYFAADERANRAEVTQADNHTIVTKALAAAAGMPVTWSVQTEAATIPDTAQASWRDAEWVQKVRQTAEEFDIPLTYHE